MTAVAPRRPAAERARRWRVIAMISGAGMAIVALPGCALLSPMPTVELIKASAGAATLAMGQGPTHASQTVFQEAPRPARICIEYNRSVALPEFVPALMAELRAYDLPSRVYEAGARPTEADCPAWLRYQGLQQWDRPPLSDEMRPYLAQATLSLHDANGHLMAASRYDSQDATLSIGRWASTRLKLAPVVRALLTGDEG